MSNKFSGKAYFQWFGDLHCREACRLSKIDMRSKGWPEWAINAYLSGGDLWTFEKYMQVNRFEL